MDTGPWLACNIIWTIVAIVIYWWGFQRGAQAGFDRGVKALQDHIISGLKPSPIPPEELEKQERELLAKEARSEFKLMN